MHPTVKPAGMIADAIRDCSKRGDLVLDPFCGSGTILIAAERKQQQGRALEIDPVYVDVAIRRWEALTGKSATLVTGETYEEVAEQRATETQVLRTEVSQAAPDRRPTYSEHSETASVGYKRPPRKTQFKPGKSGNPRGRPKRKVDMSSALNQAFNDKIVVAGTWKDSDRHGSLCSVDRRPRASGQVKGHSRTRAAIHQDETVQARARPHSAYGCSCDASRLQTRPRSWASWAAFTRI